MTRTLKKPAVLSGQWTPAKLMNAMAPKVRIALLLLPLCIACQNQAAAPDIESEPATSNIIPAAERLPAYLSQLKGKSVGLVINQSALVGPRHLVDTLLSLGIAVTKIFAPEHGIRGDADAGASIESGTDAQTGLPIVSLYGSNKKPTPDQLQGLDILVFDIQDVGVRFYTYISTMSLAMEACAEAGIPFMVLDRPNPNGHYVDGPVLEPGCESFVGMHQVPIVHGMTVGEYALMVNGEGWLKDGINVDLTVITCENYDHRKFYDLPVAPSPNLPDMESIYLYPSICLFEATLASVGRGTETPFRVVGHPDYPVKGFSFKPISKPGATSPKYEGETCIGMDFRHLSVNKLRMMRQVNITWLSEFASKFDRKDFFLKHFYKLAGTRELEKKIWTESPAEIRATWQPGLENFRKTRKKYLLYLDFE